MKQTHPKKANIIAGLLSLCLTLFCPMAKAEKAIYTLQGRTLIINEGVTEINEKDFPSGIDGEITKVELPTSLQKIGNSTFAFCTSLKSINLPPSLTEIGDSAFYYCRNLKKIEIPNAVSRIGSLLLCILLIRNETDRCSKIINTWKEQIAILFLHFNRHTMVYLHITPILKTKAISTGA